MTAAVALKERAPDDCQATLDILNRMWGAAPPPGTARRSATAAVVDVEAPTAPVVESKKARGSRAHLRLVSPSDPVPDVVAVPASSPDRVADSFFAKAPTPPAPLRTTLPVAATALGMPRVASWLRTGAMVYAGGMTAMLIAGTALWPR